MNITATYKNAEGKTVAVPDANCKTVPDCLAFLRSEVGSGVQVDKLVGHAVPGSYVIRAGGHAKHPAIGILTIVSPL